MVLRPCRVATPSPSRLVDGRVTEELETPARRRTMSACRFRDRQPAQATLDFLVALRVLLLLVFGLLGVGRLVSTSIGLSAVAREAARAGAVAAAPVQAAALASAPRVRTPAPRAGGRCCTPAARTGGRRSRSAAPTIANSGSRNSPPAPTFGKASASPIGA
jgi:Flp pilus assembly protein TadG